jgi:intracellular sulfur oxidation DsrE/DsrF family protein
MKYTLLSLIFGLLATLTTSAQMTEVDNSPYKIVMQLTSSDTAVHRGLIKQINNVLNAAPKSKIEVVCHNNGLNFLVSAKTFQAEAIQKLKAKG